MGEWVPNTAFVKMSPSLAHISSGLQYVTGGLVSLLPISALAGAGFICGLVVEQTRKKTLFLFIPTLVWLGYIAFIGGDIFPAWRHIVPIIPFLGLGLATGTGWLVRRSQRLSPYIIFLLVSILLVWYARSQMSNQQNLNAVRETWEEYGRVVGLMLKRGFGARQPLLAVEPAGAVGYWSELPALDMLGLNDYYIPRHPPANFGTGWIGHELGDGEYVYSQSPDLLLFCLPWGGDEACYLSGKQMQQNPHFNQDYTPVYFMTKRPYFAETLIFVRRESEKIGIHREPGKITIPAYLWNANPNTRAMIDREPPFYIQSGEGIPARITSLQLPPGNWRIQTVPAVEFKTATRQTGLSSSAWSRMDSDVVNVSSQAGQIDLEITPIVMTKIQEITLIQLP